MEQWDRVASAVRVRRGVLGLSQAEAAAIAHITPSTWRNLEGAKRSGYRDGTLVMVALALGWEPEAIIRIRDGAPVPDESQDPALREELAQLRREVETLRDEQGKRIGEVKDLVERLNSIVERRDSAAQSPSTPPGRPASRRPGKSLPPRQRTCQARGCKKAATVVVERPSPPKVAGLASPRLVSLCDEHEKQFRQGIPVPTKEDTAP